jgi:MSHA biogenesis protein MshE
VAPPAKVRLGELLVRQQVIREEQLDAALKRQRASGHKLGRTLVDAGFVSEEQICGALARQMRIPYINLKQFAFNAALVQTLPEAQARRFRPIVLDENGGALRIGLANPTDFVAYDELTRLLKREIDLAVVSESQLMTSIDRLYRRTGEISALSLELTAELAQTEADFGASAGADTALKDAPVVKLLQTLFEDAIQVRASDIHIEPQEKNLHVRFRIDGVLHLQTESGDRSRTTPVPTAASTASRPMRRRRRPARRPRAARRAATSRLRTTTTSGASCARR